jgi:excisionase family DNA binding protein
MTELDQIIGLDELPKWLHVTRKTIVDGVREGRDLPAHFCVGRKILFRKSAVLAWIEAQESAANKAAAMAAQEPGPAA